MPNEPNSTNILYILRPSNTNLNPEEEVPKVITAGRKLKAGVVEKVFSLEHDDIPIHQLIQHLMKLTHNPLL